MQNQLRIECWMINFYFEDCIKQLTNFFCKGLALYIREGHFLVPVHLLLGKQL